MTMGDINQGILHRFENALRPIYRERCGDEESYYLVESAFESHMSVLPLEQILKGESLYSSMANHFDEFLANGNCHSSSPSAITTSLSREIRSASNPLNAFVAWLKFINLFSQTLQRDIAETHIYAGRKNNLVKIVSDEIPGQAILLARKMDSKLDKFFESLPPVLRILIAAQRGTLRDIINYISLTVTSYLLQYLGSSDKKTLNALLENLEDARNTLANPLFWIRDSYENIDFVTKTYGNSRTNHQRKLDNSTGWIFYNRRDTNDLGVSIRFRSGRPIQISKPEEPENVRSIIDLIIFAAAVAGNLASPINLIFNWNKLAKVIQITSKELGILYDHPIWPYAVREISQFQTAKSTIRFLPDTIFIGVNTTSKIGSPASSSDPGSNAGGMGDESSRTPIVADYYNPQSSASPTTPMIHEAIKVFYPDQSVYGYGIGGFIGVPFQAFRFARGMPPFTSNPAFTAMRR